ncbi:MAG: hypothetical protein GXZ05_11000 [Gammaproteobacteria bacterium]|jgi:uncharacterized protein GlcG (DUF336 family)|nr:hypothetical protein [Gammaproteobacteria bacterium]
MLMKPVLSLDDVQRILNAARDHALNNGWAVSIAVVDDGGHLLGMLRLDGAFPLCAEIAVGKARFSAVGRWETGLIEELVNQGAASFLSLAEGVKVKGGAPIVVDGQVVGAVGVSGVTADQDLETARAGIAAL